MSEEDTKGKGEEEKGGLDPLVAEIRELASATAAVAKNAAPQPDPPEDPQAKLNSAMEDFNKLCEDGKYKEGLQKVMQAIPQAPKADITKAPGYGALTRAVAREVRQGHQWVFDAHGDEVKQAIADLPPEQRMDEDAVQRVVRDVEAAHSSEFIEHQVEERIKKRDEERDTSAPTIAPDLRLGESDDTELHGLTHEERVQAQSYGVSYKEYARQKKKEPVARDPYGGVEILDPISEHAGGNVVKPGEF